MNPRGWVDPHLGFVALMLTIAAGCLSHPSDAAEIERFTDEVTGKRWTFSPVESRLLVEFSPDLSSSARRQLIEAYGLREERPFLKPYAFGVYQLPERDRAREILNELRRDPRVRGADLARRDQDGFTKDFLPAELTVQFRPTVSTSRIRDLLAREGSRIVRKQWTPGYYRVSVPPGSDVFDAMKRFRTYPEVEFAEPSGLSYDDATNFPTDPLLSEQWHLENTSQLQGWTAGADLRIQDAWTITRGRSDVVLCIIDTGVDLDHPDLRNNLVPRNGEDWDFSSDLRQAPSDFAGHGTACAGIAVATADNGIGGSGVAPGCLVMPLKVDLTSGLNANRADAINYAASRKEDFSAMILSLSWGLSSGDYLAVHAAIRNAWSRGCLLFAASGNANGPISFPARYPEVIAVGASTPCDERKSPTSCDGETYWGSNYGPEQELVAPGVRILTTDRTGSFGYSPGDYTSTFNGTSAACPGAAGVAALVFSANPTLSNLQVRTILQATAADRVGSIEEDPPGPDDAMGHGRVDAAKAVRWATDHPLLQIQNRRLREFALHNHNGRIEPGEWGSVDFELLNAGTAKSQEIEILLSTDRPDLVVPIPRLIRMEGLQVAESGPVTRRLMFSTNRKARCGETVGFTLEIREGEELLRSEFSLTFGADSPWFFDDFESDRGYFSPESSNEDSPWARVEVLETKSPIFAWFSSAVGAIKDDRLLLSTSNLPERATLSFWQRYGTESGFDGGVLEISVDGGGSFTDLEPYFLKGKYDLVLSQAFSNPLGGRRAWSGHSGTAMHEVRVDLSDFAGASVLLRWRLGCDSSVAGDGWAIDDVSILVPRCAPNSTSLDAALHVEPRPSPRGVGFEVRLELHSNVSRSQRLRLHSWILLPDGERIQLLPRFTRETSLPGGGRLSSSKLLESLGPIDPELAGPAVLILRVTDRESGALLALETAALEIE